jgi:predicted acylesterase/phospholipase RssA
MSADERGPAVLEDDGPAPNPGGLPAFVLSGGGNLGALQVGMMYALVERGIRPGMIVGTSVGAINGAFLASRLDLPGIEEIAHLWASLRRKDVLGVDFGTLVGGVRGRPRHLFDSSSIRRLLESTVAFRRLEDAPVPLTVVATALDTKEAVTFTSGDVTTALLASSAVPRLLPPVEIDGRLFVDGAASADIPLRQALALGADDVYVLPTAPAQVAAALGNHAPDAESVGCPEGVTVRVIPPPDLHIPLAHLGQSAQLCRIGYERALAWLDGKPMPSAAPPTRRVARHVRSVPAVT